MAATAIVPKPPRLRFIDLARSLAIVLMLEGHFVGLTLADDFRDPEHPVYATWNFVRGMTAPLFFTVAGLVFVYLLTGETQARFRDKPRVRKGLKRAAILLFWGYVLQISVREIPRYLGGEVPDWVVGFHVLQCIGVGLIGLLGVAWIGHHVRIIPLAAWMLLAAGGLLWLHGWLVSLPLDQRFPAGAPLMVQNLFKGPGSIFPIAPWLGYAFCGGAAGALVRRHRGHVGSWWFALAFAAAGGAFKGAAGLADLISRGTPALRAAAEGHSWFYGRTAEVLWILAVLLVVEQRWKIRDGWWLRVGRHTFPIYVIHVIVLYGGIFKIGVENVWAKALTPWQAAAGAVGFVALFVLMIPVFERIGSAWAGFREGRGRAPQ